MKNKPSIIIIEPGIDALEAIDFAGLQLNDFVHIAVAQTNAHEDSNSINDPFSNNVPFILKSYREYDKEEPIYFDKYGKPFVNKSKFHK